MKNLVLLLVVGSLFVLASCGEAKLEKDIEGTWRVNKYLLNGGDRTAQLNASKSNYIWVFNKDKSMSRSWNYSSDSVAYRIDTSYSGGLRFFDTTQITIPVSGSSGDFGTWLLTNSNKYLQTTSNSGTVEYQIIEHKSSSLHLFCNGEDYYLVPR